MKYSILLFTMLFLFGTSNAQYVLKKFGDVSEDELKLSHYSKDESAEALVLLDIGKSYFSNTEKAFDVIYERTTRIKIFSDAGLNWAEVRIPFYQEEGIVENVSDIEAYTCNLDNGVIRKTFLDLDDCYEEKINDSWNAKVFALPNVRKGSVIEYRYKIRSQYLFNLRDWEFQRKIPTVYSEYEVKMIPFYEYRYILQGANKFDSQDSYLDPAEYRFASIPYKVKVHKYIMTGIPAFVDEEYISSINDYIIKLDFQLSRVIQPDGTDRKILSTWPDLVDGFIKHKDFGKHIKRSEKLAGKIFDLNSLSLIPVSDRYSSIMEYVKGNFSWNNNAGKYASKSPDKLLKDKYGNSADINLFTIGLLRSAGINTYPLLISTRENGKIRYNHPYSHFFNYVLISANVDNRVIISDATERFASNDRIPPRCINDKGLVIIEKFVDWLDLYCKFPSEVQEEISINLTDSDLHANFMIARTEYDALHFRNVYGENIKELKDMLHVGGYSVIDSSIIVDNQFNMQEPYTLKFSIKSNVESVNDKIYIPPFLNEIITDNPLKQTTRTYPLDFTYPKKRSYSTTIIIPDGYKLDFVPSDTDFSNDGFDLHYSSIYNENTIHISFSYFFKNSVYSPQQYSRIKSYFNQIIKKGNEKVVLSKRETDTILE